MVRMRWSIIRLIWLRELRDQLRDRRTLFMVAGLPVLLYPILGVAVLKFAVGFVDRKTIVGLVSGPHQPHEFPPLQPSHQTAVQTLGWLTQPLGLPQATSAAALAHLPPRPTSGWSAIPPATAVAALAPAGAGADQLAAAATFAAFSHFAYDYPLLAHGDRFMIAGAPPALLGDSKLQIVWLDTPDRNLLTSRKVDVLLWVPPDFWASLDHGHPTVILEGRPGDDASRLAAQRLYYTLARWKNHLKEVRFSRKQLPAGFDDPFTLAEPDGDKDGGSRSMLDLLVRIFPFMLVMWSLAGALYPAVDLCAGEKERGTMETLLISPAGREEIVWGKFLTIWVFSGGTALLNLLSMGLTTWWFGSQLPRVELTAGGLFWCVLLLLPLSAFFSAVCLSIGAYARSTKEGQYYLMPLFLVTMPLIFLTLAPGVELNSFYSMVPVTGVALLMQRLLISPGFDQPWLYFVSVMAPIGLYSWLALRWAIDQFQREEVLFREAERVDVRLWLRRLFRDKETRPTTGQALFCFALLLALRWFSESLGQDVSLLIRSGIVVAAFVAAPPIFMALLLTTRPRQVLALRWPAWPYLAAAVLLFPLVAWAVSLAYQFPRLLELLRDRQTLVEQAVQSGGTSALLWTCCIVALALLTAAGKEIAFRGFIFAGLLKRMRPWPAILVSSFLFAAFHMNVFLLPPLFLLGIALGILALRSGSLLPGILLHGSCYALLLLGSTWPDLWDAAAETGVGQYVFTALATAAAAALLWWQNRRTGSGLVEALLALPEPVTPVTPDIDGACGSAAAKPQAAQSLPDE
jgi:sodium transport system permease protein